SRGTLISPALAGERGDQAVSYTTPWDTIAVIFDRPFVLCTSPVSCASGHERLPEPRRRPKNTCCDF
ncbi:hypothetical protein, partial [Mesorhizobium sp. M1378]|uniref:hypothetical protein n=1 Tax=Mesorhizobium sp. M1378 TaxID=2957092 RepID=UPI00333C5C0E